MNRAPQFAIIVSAGLLLFVVSQWPQYTIGACLAMFAVIAIALRFLRPAAPVSTARKPWRRIATAVIAAILLLWVLFSLRRT